MQQGRQPAPGEPDQHERQRALEQGQRQRPGQRRRGVGQQRDDDQEGTAARSWNSRMPTPRRPWRSCNSFCSASWVSTMAVDDSAAAAPNISAPRQSTPNAWAIANPASVPPATCTLPTPSR